MNTKATQSQKSNPSFSMDDFAKALDKYDYQFNKGDKIKGKVFQYAPEGAYVDIGAKAAAFLPLREVSLQEEVDLAELLPMQEELEFLIISDQNEDGQLTISRRQLEIRLAWDKIEELAEAKHSVQIHITGINKGGVTGDCAGLKGFIPRSHLIERNNLESLIGETLTANFLEVNQKTNKLILSQRQMAQAAAITQFTKGELVEGRVSKIQPYGVFVDLNGLTGLLHITQVSGTHVDALTTVFKYGQQIKVLITDIDPEKNRISLSTKLLESYPGEILQNIDQVMAEAVERVENLKKKEISE